MRQVRLAASAAVLLLATACAGTASPGLKAGAPHVSVDTPELRAVKADADVAPCRPGDGTTSADGLPAITLPCLGGGKDVDLSRLRGPMVVNLWAQWCTPCRTELPIYQRLHEQGKGKVSVLGIDYQDTQPLAALELVRDSGVTYPLLADPDSSLESAYPLRGLPFVIFVDASGAVVDTQYVAIKSYKQLRDLVREKLGVDL